MNSNEQSFLEKASDNFFKFAKEFMPSAMNNAAISATPLLAVAAVQGGMFAMAVMNRDPSAVASAYFSINNPDSSVIMAGLRGQLPYDLANKTYQYAAAALATGAASGVLTKVVEKFGSLREEAQHLRKENEMLKREFANDRATQSSDGRPLDTLRSRLDAGLSSVQAKQGEREQATRVKPGPGMR